MIRRTYWWSDLTPGPDEPLALSLLKYNMAADRHRVVPGEASNLVSSHIHGSKLHAPVLDIDIPHHYVRSTTHGHTHLYIDLPMSRWRMMVMLFGLYVAGVIEMGNFWWSLRRGATFVRPEGVGKSEEETLSYSYGMFFKLRRKS